MSKSLSIVSTVLMVLVSACGQDEAQEKSAQPVTTAAKPDEVQVQDPTIVVGPQGPKGDKGDKGDKGETGQTGLDGADGQDGQTVTGTAWLDPIADTYWTLSTEVTWLDEACSGPYRLPTKAEVQLATARGLYLAALGMDPTIARVWVADQLFDINGDPLPNDTYYVFGSGLMGGAGPTDEAAYFCIENGEDQ